ncbi:MAG: hypothetical protein GY749_47985 [Desulfobacteraceae bacterium]|nr:hypothetical protein [Desulfobacteraceae bacterium]
MELIIEETDWEPEDSEKKKSVTDDWIAGVRIGIDETELQKKVKAAAAESCGLLVIGVYKSDIPVEVLQKD